MERREGEGSKGKEEQSTLLFYNRPFHAAQVVRVSALLLSPTITDVKVFLCLFSPFSSV